MAALAHSESVSAVHAREATNAEERVRAAQQDARRSDEASRSATARLKALEAQLTALQAEHGAAEAHAASVARYTSMTVEGRVKEAATLCTPQAACTPSTLGEIIDSAKGTSSLPDIAARITRVAAQHEEGVRVLKQREAARQAMEIAAEKRRAAEAEEASRGLHCCDGSPSPTCLCHAASHQGCCSHHGGVCGCER